MPHSHYVIDLFYAIGGEADQFRREVLRIDVENDDAAIAEGQRIDLWRKTSFYQIRSIRTSARSGDKLIYDSRPAEVTPPDAAAEAVAKG